MKAKKTDASGRKEQIMKIANKAFKSALRNCGLKNDGLGIVIFHRKKFEKSLAESAAELLKDFSVPNDVSFCWEGKPQM